MLIREWSSCDELLHVVRDNRVDAIVVPLGADGLEATEILRAVDTNRMELPPIIANFTTAPVSVDQAKQLTTAFSCVRLFFGVLGVTEMVAALDEFRRGELQARDYLVHTLVPEIDRQLGSLLIPAIVIGCRRSSTADLSKASGIHERTIRNRLKSAGLPGPTELLGLITGCRIAFDTNVNQLSISLSATRSGFATGDELRDFLKTRTGLPPSFWKRTGLNGSIALLRERLNWNDKISAVTESG